MTRKFKALGLALFAVMAASALSAQGAQAAEFHCASTSCIITGELHPQFNSTGGEHTDKFTVESGSGLTVECDTAKYEGTQPTEAAKTVTLTPTYGSTTSPSGCKAAGSEATIHTQHCAYVFSAATDAEEHGPVEVQCSGTSENEILVTVPGLGVTLHVAAQKPNGGVHYTNVQTPEKPKEITSHTTVKGITTTCTGIGCFFVGNATSSYSGTETLRANKDTCAPAEGTAKTTPSFSGCEGEQVNATYE